LKDKSSSPDVSLPSERHGRCFTGKIREVVFDCFGEPETIKLETCDGVIQVRCSERRLGDLAWRACRHRSVVTLCLNPEPNQTIREFIVQAGRT